jgi:WD domain, G-beta repeat
MPIIALLNADFQLLVYDLKSKQIIHGHKGHVSDKIHIQHKYSSVVFTSPEVILSSIDSDVIHYNIVTNTFKIFSNFSNRNSITIMKALPNNTVAAGTKNGLVLLFDAEKLCILSKLRGHDSEITSLDYTTYELSTTSVLKQSNLQHNDSDLFDIYTCEDVKNEFGTYQEQSVEYSDCEEMNNPALQEKVHTTSDFNFLEACNNLRDQILSSSGNEQHAEKNDGNTPSYEETKLKYNINNRKSSSQISNLSLESNASSSTHSNDEECEKKKDFLNILPKQANSEIIVLATGSKECTVFLWDADNHSALHKINIHPKPKPMLPAIFTNVQWANNGILFITDNNGDLLLYKITFDGSSKKISHEKTKKTFDAKGILNICKTNDNSFIWLSSIHRHICCLDTIDFKKIISLDTLQVTIFCIVDNPFESHLIAIGGNDKRICLWNTSDAHHHHKIVLKPFMNKVHNSVLCISWHPEKESALAFSTREGRIGILDTSKFSNVPIILQCFFTSEVYSMAWAKLQDPNGTKNTILLVCSAGKLIFYNQNDNYKITETNLTNVSSLAVNERLLAIGTTDGNILICDLCEKFNILAERKLCRKYVGGIDWHKSKLSISSEIGITLITNINQHDSILMNDDNVKTFFHNKGRVFSAKFNRPGDHIVSCCKNGYVNVWNVETLDHIASIYMETPVFSAIFMPNNENMVICGGLDSVVAVYEWKKYLVGSSASAKPKKNKTSSFEWAKLSELNTVGKKSKHSFKVNQKSDDGEIIEITKKTRQMNLSKKKKIGTLFDIANREISLNPLDYIKNLLTNESREKSLNEKMLNGNREEVKIIFEKKCEYFKVN